MLYRQYKYKFYLNINHSVQMNDIRGEIHSHTWEIATGIAPLNEEFTRFSDIEAQLNSILEMYQDRYINEIAPFEVLNPTLENVCDYLFEKISRELKNNGWLLLIIEMSETPSRVYRVTGIGDDHFTFV